MYIYNKYIKHLIYLKVQIILLFSEALSIINTKETLNKINITSE